MDKAKKRFVVERATKKEWEEACERVDAVLSDRERRLREERRLVVRGLGWTTPEAHNPDALSLLNALPRDKVAQFTGAHYHSEASRYLLEQGTKEELIDWLGDAGGPSVFAEFRSWLRDSDYACYGHAGLNGCPDCPLFEMCRKDGGRWIWGEMRGVLTQLPLSTLQAFAHPYIPKCDAPVEAVIINALEDFFLHRLDSPAREDFVDDFQSWFGANPPPSPWRQLRSFDADPYQDLAHIIITQDCSLKTLDEMVRTYFPESWKGLDRHRADLLRYYFGPASSPDISEDLFDALLLRQLREWLNCQLHRTPAATKARIAQWLGDQNPEPLKDRLENGENISVSMGCRVPYDVCSICADWSRITLNPKKDVTDYNYDSLAVTRARGYPIWDGVPEPEPRTLTVSVPADCKTLGDREGECSKNHWGIPLRLSGEHLGGLSTYTPRYPLTRINLAIPEPIDELRRDRLESWINTPVGTPDWLPRKHKTEL